MQTSKSNTRGLNSLDELIEVKYGKHGTATRDKFETDALAFRLGEMLKQARKDVGITQEELANRTGTKKSYISRIERGLSDIQMSTYYKLIATGLGRKLKISIESMKHI